MTFAETELSEISSRLAAVMLLVESGDASMCDEARVELKRIEDYIHRIAECAAKMGVKMTGTSP